MADYSRCHIQGKFERLLKTLLHCCCHHLFRLFYQVFAYRIFLEHHLAGAGFVSLK
jgi:hypothetical protein